MPLNKSAAGSFTFSNKISWVIIGCQNRASNCVARSAGFFNAPKRAITAAIAGDIFIFLKITGPAVTPLLYLPATLFANLEEF